MRWAKRIAFVLALAFLGLTLLNASWLAATPVGAPKLVADGGMRQVAVSGEPGTCDAARIEPPYHDFLPNTARSIRQTTEMGIRTVALDIAMSADGELVAFGDAMLDCRTDGTGKVAAATLDELKALDIGHGYTADGGESFPFRGQGVAGMPTLAEALRILPPHGRFVYRLAGDDPALADRLAQALQSAGRDPAKQRDGFFGAPASIERIRERLPEAWAWTRAEAQACTEDYRLTGWTGLLPASCKGGTMLVRLDEQGLLWGWPNRLIARMEAHGGEIVMAAPGGPGEPLRGLTLPEQLGEIPSSYNGYVLVEDAWVIAPALFPRSDDRSQAQRDAAAEAITRRRAAN